MIQVRYLKATHDAFPGQKKFIRGDYALVLELAGFVEIVQTVEKKVNAEIIQTVEKKLNAEIVQVVEKKGNAEIVQSVGKKVKRGRTKKN